MTKPPPLPPSLLGDKGAQGGRGEASGTSSPKTGSSSGPSKRGRSSRQAKRTPTASKSDITFKPVRTKRNFGRFQLLMELAQGGMATLYLAKLQGPEHFQKLLAIKKIHDHLAGEEEFISMFLDEARITALIHHPNVVTIFDMGQIDGAYFLAMEYVHGENLTTILRASARVKQRLPWEYAARIVADAAAGLHAAHELRGPDGQPLNVVHRDVSPQNILVSYDGHVKVVDFGVALAAERITHTTAGTLKGKVSYMSPEQTMRRDIDRRSDIFALGIVLFESVCLKRLFREETEALTLLKIRNAEIPKPRSIRPDIPVELERIILKALAKDPDDRYQTAQELEEALNNLLVSKGKSVGPVQIAELMEKLFHEKRKIKDEQIRNALESQGDEPLEGFGMGGTTGTKFEPPTATQHRRAPVWAVLVGGGLVGLGLLVLAVVLLTGRNEKKERRNEKRPEHIGTILDAGRPPSTRPARDAAPPKPKDVTLHIEVEPKGAKPVVVFRGQEYHVHVLEQRVAQSSAEEVILVKAKGYRSETVRYVPDRNRIIRIELKKKHRPRRSDRLMDLPE